MECSIKSFSINKKKIIPPRRGVTIFVGPNNSGKTRVLNEMIEQVRNKNMTGILVDEVEVEKKGEIEEWLNDNCEAISVNGQIQYRLWGSQRRVGAEYVKPSWLEKNLLGTGIGYILIENLGVEDRLVNFIDPRENDNRYQGDYFNPENSEALTVAHWMLKKPEFKKKVFEKTKQILGIGLSVTRRSYGEVVCLVGEEFIAQNASPDDGSEWGSDPSKYQEYRSQGHGIQAVLNILGVLEATRAPIVVIDEPELFLHPPLAYKIGQLIGSLANERQVFIATHSEHVLNGILSKTQDVEIIRFSKRPGGIYTDELDPATVRELWADARLRYTRLPQGLFHDLVVLCENNTDCMFYAAAKDEYFRKNQKLVEPDISFIDCNGKNAFDKFSKVLKSLTIPTAYITDIDYLVLKQGKDKNESDGYINSMVNMLGVEDPFWIWKPDPSRDKIKQHGLKSIELRDDEKNNLELCIDKFREKGFFILKTGSLESFKPGSQKSKWFTEAMENKVFAEEEPQRLIEEILSFF